MSEQKESSVLFSLKELMNLEEDRIRGEEADKAAHVAAQEEARRQAERAARDAEHARIQAEEERRRAEELRGREETARLEAIRVAEVEKARLEAEQHARLQAMNSQQQHQLQIETIRKDEGKKRLRNILIAVISAVLLIGGVSIYLAVDASKKNDAREAAAKEEIRKKDEELAQLKAKAEEANRNVANLEVAQQNAKTQAEKDKLQIELNKARAEAAEANQAAGTKTPAAGGVGPRPGKGGDDKPEVKKPCGCKSTDPLCDCL